MLTISSLALFTDQAVSEQNSFGTGTIDIAASPATAAITGLDLAPGDSVTAPLTITNNGSLDLRYSITSTTSEDVLAAELEMTVRSAVSDCDDNGWNQTGTELYRGPLGSTAPMAIVGSAAQGDDGGDRDLGAADAEELCVHVELPLAADTSLEGLSTESTLTFEAEQTRNNP